MVTYRRLSGRVDTRRPDVELLDELRDAVTDYATARHLELLSCHGRTRTVVKVADRIRIELTYPGADDGKAPGVEIFDWRSGAFLAADATQLPAPAGLLGLIAGQLGHLNTNPFDSKCAGQQ